MDLSQCPNAESTHVLVVVMNNARDWEIACTEGWYRIPEKRAPRQIAAEYLAFYFTRPFGPLAWAVHYIAPILHYRRARRDELLPDESDHPRAQDWYYCIEVGPVKLLPRPIPSQRLRRLTFLPTTLDRLLSAEEINDLWVREGLEQRLWEALKGAGIRAEGSLEVKEGGVRYVIPIAIPCAVGGVSVNATVEVQVPPGWVNLRAKPEDGAELWGALLSEIIELSAKRGGMG
jgi:hypothetical protein